MLVACFPSDVGACVYEYARQLNAVDGLFVIDRTLLARQRSLSRDSPQRLEGWLGLEARLLIDSAFEIRVRGRRNPDRSRARSGLEASARRRRTDFFSFPGELFHLVGPKTWVHLRSYTAIIGGQG